MKEAQITSKILSSYHIITFDYNRNGTTEQQLNDVNLFTTQSIKLKIVKKVGDRLQGHQISFLK